MLLEEIWFPFPLKYHVCFRHWYREHHTAAWSSEIWAVEAGRWLCMASALALLDQLWAKSQSAWQSQSVTHENPNSRWIFENRLFLHVQPAFTRHFNAYKTLPHLCIAFFHLSDWPHAAARCRPQRAAGAVTGSLCPRWMIRAEHCHTEWEGARGRLPVLPRSILALDHPPHGSPSESRGGDQQHRVCLEKVPCMTEHEWPDYEWVELLSKGLSGQSWGSND